MARGAAEQAGSTEVSGGTEPLRHGGHFCTCEGFQADFAGTRFGRGLVGLGVEEPPYKQRNERIRCIPFLRCPHRVRGLPVTSAVRCREVETF